MTNTASDDTRDASLRVAKRLRDALKAFAAIQGRPLYDVTNEAIEEFMSKDEQLNSTIRKARTRNASEKGKATKASSAKKRGTKRAA